MRQFSSGLIQLSVLEEVSGRSKLVIRDFCLLFRLSYASHVNFLLNRLLKKHLFKGGGS